MHRSTLILVVLALAACTDADSRDRIHTATAVRAEQAANGDRTRSTAAPGAPMLALDDVFATDAPFGTGTVRAASGRGGGAPAVRRDTARATRSRDTVGAGRTRATVGAAGTRDAIASGDGRDVIVSSDPRAIATPYTHDAGPRDVGARDVGTPDSGHADGDTASLAARPRVDVAYPGIVRGLYLNRWVTQSPKRMRDMIAIADSTEINALVLDLKDEFGLNYATRDTMLQRNAGRAGTIPGLRALLDTLKAHRIISIARLVVFKDSVAARMNPDHIIRTPDGSPWRDKEGLTWVNPYDRTIWEYNIRVAEELARMGFDEIQFDYIRFPEPYRSLPPQVFPGSNGESKPKALGRFLAEACPRINALGARCTADVFGLVTTVNGPLEIGQHWETLAAVTDVLLPMVYPSHYPRGAFGIDRPNADPYRVVYEAIRKAGERNRKLGIENPEHVRAWLQAFSLGQPPYGPEEIRAQKQAVYDAGFDGWILWHPGSRYQQFVPALEKETVSRKRIAPADSSATGGVPADSSAERGVPADGTPPNGSARR